MGAKLSAKDFFNNNISASTLEKNNESRSAFSSSNKSENNFSPKPLELNETSSDTKLADEQDASSPQSELSEQEPKTCLFNENSVLLSILEKIRYKHKFSFEEAVIFSRDKIELLLNSLAECKDENLEAFANAIPYEDLPLIPSSFSLSLYREEIDRLHFIAKLRNGYKFFEKSFLIFQVNFPNYSFQNFLTFLKNDLLEKENKLQQPRPLFMQDSILDFANFSSREKDLLISFIDKYLSLSRDNIDFSLKAFYKKYHIIETSPLALSLEAAIFAEYDINLLIKNIDIFKENLTEYPDVAQVKIFEKIVDDNNLENHYKLSLYKILRDKYFRDKSKIDIINSLSERCLSTYKIWLISDSLFLHCMGQDKKLKFLLSNVDVCLDEAKLSENILALRFADFIIISSKLHDEQVIYYDNASFNKLLEENYSYEELASPTFDIVLARQVIDAFRKNQPVLLSLKDNERNFSRRFFDWVSGKEQSLEDAPQGIIKRFF